MIQRRNPARTFAWLIVAALAIILSIQLLWTYSISPRLLIRRITLESDLGLSDSQLLEMLAIKGATWSNLDADALIQRLKSYPVIRDAVVVKSFPDTLKVYLYRRKPLIITLIDSNGAFDPAVFDEEGYAVQVGELIGSEDLPILSGPRFDTPALGARFPESIQEILAGLSAIRRQDESLFSMVSEIEMIPRSADVYDLKLYLNHIDIPVMVDPNLSLNELKRAVLAVEVLSTTAAGNVEEADIRGGSVIYHKLKEAQL